MSPTHPAAGQPATTRRAHSRGAWQILIIAAVLVSLTGLHVTSAQASPPTVVAPATHAARQNTPAIEATADCSTVNLTAAEDTYLSANDVTYNNGGGTALHANGTTGTDRRTSLLKWDVSTIPSAATISAASLSLYVSDASSLTFNLYNMRRSWVEGTSNRAASTTSANWNTYDGSHSWGTVGAASTTDDRYDTNLWGAGTSTFNSTGAKTVDLNSDGLAVIEDWVNGSLANYGLIIQNYSGSTNNAVYFASSEATTASQRPVLNVTYCVVTGPTITTTGTLSAFSALVGVPSAEQTYTVAGSSLTEDIVVTAPADFEISKTSGSGFGSALTLAQSGGSVAATTIYVRFNRATEGTSTGNITHTSAGATTKNVAVSGTAANCSTVNFTAAEDTYLSANDVTYNNGGNTSLHVDATTGTSRRTILLKWNVGAVPSAATISAASLSLYVSDASSLTFNLYNLRRSWVEGTSTQASSSTSANWNTYDGSHSWGTVGAASTTEDRYDTNLWGAGASTFSSTGAKTVDLNSDGRAVIEGWVNGSLANYGLIMQNYSGSTNNAVFFASSEATTASQRPVLNVTYCLPTGPTITTSGTLSAFSAAVGVPSAEQTYTVTGGNLTDDIVVTAPADFEISKTSGSGFGSSLTLTQSGGSVAATTIYVHFNRAIAGTSTGNITHTSAGATTKNVAVSGTAGAPSLTVTSAMVEFTSQVGVDSAEQTYTVAGAFLKGDITVTAPADFQISKTSGSGFATALTLSPINNTVATTTIYVKFNRASTGTSTGNITHASTDAPTQNVAVSGTVSDCNTVNLTAAEDTYLSANDVTYNNGGNTALHANGTTGTARRTSLLKWDVSSIPSGMTVESASLSVYVSDASSLTFNLYNMRRSWVEGTGNRTASTTSANWNTYDGSHSWGTVGAASTTDDRYDTNLWGAGVSTFSSTGNKTVDLNSDGRAVVQAWVDGSLDNYGLVVQNYAGSTDNALFFASSEATTTSQRPLLNITYCATNAPAITTSGTLSAFASSPGVLSTEQTYTVSGANLTDDIVVTAPADFEISLTSENGFGPSLTLSQSGGGVGTTTIYVRFNRATVGTSNGNITHTSTGAPTKNVAVTGTASNANHAPNTPALVEPGDGATGVTLAPDLKVTVSDIDGDAMNVSFYAKTNSLAAYSDFTIVAMPDTQNASQYYPAVFTAQTQWIADNMAASNIVFVTNEGDVVNTASSTTQYDNADAAIDILDTAGVPYSMEPGNHDYPLTNFNSYFGIARFSGKSWYGGSYGTGNENNYSLFSEAGMDFIMINLEYQPATAAMDWADALLKANPTRRGIVVTHSIISVDNSWTYQAVYTALKDNPNLFLMLCGHMHSGSDGAGIRTETGDNGNTIYILQADYQDYANGGNGYMRLMRFSPANDKIYITTYSPYVPGYLTDSENQFELPYDMPGGSSFQLIGTATGVASGGTATVNWPDRASGSTYEWYAIASDGSLSTTSPTWSFTTSGLPVSPAFSSITQSGSNVTLNWGPVTLDMLDNPTTITEYHVYWSNTPYFTSGTLLTPTSSATSITHTGAATGTTSWYYVVRAVNCAGESTDSYMGMARFAFDLTPGNP